MVILKNQFSDGLITESESRLAYKKMHR